MSNAIADKRCIKSHIPRRIPSQSPICPGHLVLSSVHKDAYLHPTAQYLTVGDHIPAYPSFLDFFGLFVEVVQAISPSHAWVCIV